MEIKKVNYKINFGPDRYIQCVKMGGYAKLITSTRKSDFKTKNIDKDHYLNKETGEILKKKHHSTRISNEESLRKTFLKIEELIYCNVKFPENCLWITLTYRRQEDGNPMTNTLRLQYDWDIYIKRLRRWCEKRKIDCPKYISVCEPQGSGAWHMHVILIWGTQAPYIPKDEMEEMWGQGFIWINKMSSKDNIAHYFSAYLTDIPLDEVEEECLIEQKVLEKKCPDGVKKPILKGGRLRLYPTNFNILRHSKSMNFPIKKEITYDMANQIRFEKKKIFESKLLIQIDESKMVGLQKELYRDCDWMKELDEEESEI